jgi:hypothetical protein
MNMKLNVYFVGLCTHVWWDEPPLTFTKRVVLHNATAGDVIKGKIIKSHIPTLRIAAADIEEMDSLHLPGTDGILEWKLNGGRVHIANPIDGEVVPDPTFSTCIPHLRDLMDDVGPPSEAAVDGNDPSIISCIFELSAGRLYGCTNKPGAALGLFVAETNGPPVLRFTSFETGESRTSTITLRAGARVTFSNLGACAEYDDSFDFYLHYKLAADMPVRDLILPGPDRIKGCAVVNEDVPTWPPGFKSVGPGCSNSAYP